MKIKISELKDRPLDWAVAFILYGEPKRSFSGYRFMESDGLPAGSVWVEERGMTTTLEYSSNWAQGGPLIDKFDAWIAGPDDADSRGEHAASAGIDGPSMTGHTKLTAAMRAIVAAHTDGDTVEVPDELVEVKG